MCMKYKAPVWETLEKLWKIYCLVWNDAVYTGTNWPTVRRNLTPGPSRQINATLHGVKLKTR